MKPTPLPSILKIHPYIGGDVTPPGFQRRIVLASNENPFGPSPEARRILSNAHLNISSYPSGRASKLVEAISQTYRIPEDHIICGNGSEELLHMVAKVYAGAGDEILAPQYGFLVYRIATYATGATPIFYPQPGFSHDEEAILKSLTPCTKVLFIDNPANPLGCTLMREDLKRLLENVPSHVLIVLDEAYFDFMANEDYASGLEFLSAYKNLIVLRTFSKSYGLAGLRIGYGFGHPEILDALHRVRPPFNINALSQLVGAAAVHDKAWVKKTRDHTISYRLWTQDKLKNLGFETLPSDGNFFLLDCKTPEKAQELYCYLGERGILLRPVAAYGLPQYLRVSIGKGEEMKAFVNLMEAYEG